MRTSLPAAAPEVSVTARSAVRTLVRPIERFLAIEASSGVALLACAVIAIAWANSPWGDSYERLWETPVTLGLGGLTTRFTLHFVVNDVLMVIFFFVVGLEIRREIHDGELADLRRATLPIAAAIGGMIAPALLFVAFNPSGEARRGWGVPMATDIAFAVGVLALLGKRVPSALRVLLLALAIIDDIGAIIIIALFYSSGIALGGVLVAALGLAITLIMRRIGVRHALAFILPGAVLWAGILRAGIHPTIAGVILGLLTPARAWFGRTGFLKVAHQAIEDVSEQEREQADPADVVAALYALERARREALAPVVRLQTALHGWVAFGIMPIFALANAGVHLSRVTTGGAEIRLVLGTVVGMVIGKPLGVLLAAALVVRLGIAELPRRVTYRGVLVVGAVAGVGFTMALFIAQLGLSPALLPTTKLAILGASVLASIIALALGRAWLKVANDDVTVREAERRTSE